MKVDKRALFKAILFFAVAIGSFYVSFAFAQSGIGGLASNVQKSFGPIAKLITGASFVAGLGFALAAILKFKAHRDNPQQVPVGTPIALMFIAVALLFLPHLFSVAGKTVFGSSGGSSTGSVSGTPTIS